MITWTKRTQVLSALLILLFFALLFGDAGRCFEDRRGRITERELGELLPELKNVRFLNKGDLLKQGVLFEGAEDIETYGCSLYIEGDLNKDGQMDVAVCGAYYDQKDGTEKPFLLILTGQHPGRYRKEFFMAFDRYFFICRETELIKFRKNEVLTVGFKAHSDLMGVIMWDGNNYIFKHHIAP